MVLIGYTTPLFETGIQWNNVESNFFSSSCFQLIITFIFRKAKHLSLIENHYSILIQPKIGGKQIQWLLPGRQSTPFGFLSHGQWQWPPLSPPFWHIHPFHSKCGLCWPATEQITPNMITDITRITTICLFIALLFTNFGKEKISILFVLKLQILFQKSIQSTERIISFVRLNGTFNNN